MTEFKVVYKVSASVIVTVQAEDMLDAIDLANQDAHISAFAGNGGSDKLIGVYGDNIIIEHSDYMEIDEGLTNSINGLNND